MSLYIQPNLRELWNALTIWLAEVIANQNEVFHMALPGGSTPESLFRYWANSNDIQIPWSKVHFWWTDERMVSPQDPQSNFRMANESFLKALAIPEKNIHRILGEFGLQKAASLYGMELEDSLLRQERKIPLLDLILLGVGPDGHVASLFPEQAPAEIHPWAVTSYFQKKDRVSLPYEVILAAKQIAFVVTGDSKKEIVQRILHPQNQKDRELPASIVWAKRPDSIWWVDQEVIEPSEKL